MNVNEIINSEIVLNHFGYWPSFHDAEILELKFYLLVGERPTLDMKIYVFESTDRLDKEGRFIRDKKCILTFEFQEISNNKFSGFYSQNILGDLDIKEVDYKFRIWLNTDMGIEGKFDCELIIVKSLEIVHS
jgi:hypothetical protein